jgi:hypothetical protein
MRSKTTERRIFFAVMLMGLAAIVSGNWERCREFLEPSWAFVWKMPLLYLAATITFWTICFGIVYDGDKDHSGDGAIALFFLPLFPFMWAYYLVKDIVKEMRNATRKS